MSAISDARSDLVALFRYGDDEQRPIIEELRAAYKFEPKPGDATPPYLAVWQDGATDDNQFFRFQVRVYADMSLSAFDGQELFDDVCLKVEQAFTEDPEFVCTGWQTEWNGDLLVGMWDVRIGRTDVV